MKTIQSFTFAAITCFLLLISPTIVNAQWRNSTPFVGTFNDIAFPDQLTGYACGPSGGIGNCTLNSSVHKTMDGGKNWVRHNTGVNNAMNKLLFLDAYTGWALGASSTVIKTTDGGMSWVSQTSGIGAGLNDISFPDANTGYVVGLNGILRKSTNGGGTWQTITSGVTGTINGVSFVNPNLGFFAASNGVIRKTTNGGTSWQTVYTGTEFLKDIHFVDANNGIAMSVTRFLITSNGGTSWTPVDTDPLHILLRMQLINNNLGFAINDANQLLKTTDNGLTWSTTDVPSGYNLSCLYMLNQQKGYFGANIGQIVITEDGGNTIFGLTSGLIGRVENLHFRNRTQGILVSGNGGILNTQNAGLTFGKRESGTTVNLSTVQWLTDTSALVVGDSGVVLKTTDAGLTFNRIQTSFTNTITDLWAVDSLYAYAALGNGRVLKTIDAGETWTFQTTLAIVPFYGIHFLNRNVGMVVGDNEIYKTSNGGASWIPCNTGIPLNGDLSEVWVISPSIAYAVGGFGKMYKTINGGDLWEPIFPDDNTNAEISEMQFFSEDTAYFSRLSSQHLTFDGAATVGSASTACLANNGGMNTIHLPERNWGFAGGGLGGVFHSLQQLGIYRTYLQDSTFCPGSKLLVGYNASGLFINTHTFTAQISNNAGSFANPVNIGSLVLPTPHTIPAGIITCTLPANLNGTGYRIRVVCDDPALIGPDNGYDITIANNLEPLVSIISPNQELDCSNNFLNLTAAGTALGLNPSFVWRLNGSIVPSSGNQVSLTDLSGVSEIIVQAQSSLLCTTTPFTTDTLFFTIGAAPEVFAGNDTTLCFGETLNIGEASNLTASWFPTNFLSDPNSPITIASPQENVAYILTLTDLNGCAGKDTVNITVNSLPTTPVITENAGYLIINVAEGNSISWLLNGEIIQEEVNDSLLIFSFGDYTANVVDEFGCNSTSAVYNVSSVSNQITHQNVNDFNVIQQNNTLILNGLGNLSTEEINIYDISGRIVHTSALAIKDGSTSISLPQLIEGIYFISVRTSTQQLVKKVLFSN
jgi:photosystem II stability/assembly factor-like uncharacterized protein